MDLVVKNRHLAVWGDCPIACAVGRNGFIDADLKREGDGATPKGRWVMREVLYRADKMNKPETVLPVRSIKPDDGWCDSSTDPNYNKHVKHPYPASAEKLWRADNAYDLVVVLGYNDDPPVPDKGSAIFLHLAPLDFTPSAGCVTLPEQDLLTILREADAHCAVLVDPWP